MSAAGQAPHWPPLQRVLAVRLGPGANCSSAGSAIDVLFYGSLVVGALAAALSAALPPRPPEPNGGGNEGGNGGGEKNAEASGDERREALR